MNDRFRRGLGRLAAVMVLGGAVLLLPTTSAVAQTSASSTVSVWIDGWGSGTVTSRPAGINCHLATPVGYPYEHAAGEDQSISGTCHADFPVGTAVTLTATPDAGSELNYLDCGGGMASPCTRTVASGYNGVWAMFCPRDGLCSAG
ncbi:hypothetical protein GCM10010472_12040 [Pseudonocardia halophobica]|uniref:Secreted protein n=1 Tax=Pseudonocardia halophobica TaxID=29401 RepID=A0A9W6L6B3_9PSEU|nr:hypothetical protein [Pseudonocardia halophobica]GLL11874.1 hypothetical protein GCM10017577_30150 [Pseudonocardia halophobica]